MEQKTRKVKLKQFGRIDEQLLSDFETWVWSSKYGNNLEEPKDSSLIVRFSHEKKDYSDKNKIPKYMNVLFGVIQKKKRTSHKSSQTKDI